MLPEVALVDVNARVMVVFEPAVTTEGVAVRVAVGAADDPLPLEEPPQLARTTQKLASNAKQARRR
jgi:hypothetical protein